MTNFKNDDTFLAKWLANDLTPEELKQFKNAEDYKIYEKIIESSSKFEIPTFDEVEVKKQIDTSIQRQAYKTKRKWLNYTLGIAASIALLFSVLVVSFWNTSITIACNFGEIKNVTLPDGSKVSLNGNSEITYSEKEWEDQNRELFLKGEGFFVVKEGSKFTVKTIQGEVQVVGTEFNVKTLNNFYKVECYKGKVLVKKSNTDDVLLTPGNGLHYVKNKMKPLTLDNVNPNWKNRNYVYKNIPLSVVFNDLQNVYSIPKLNVEKVDLNLEFTGKLVVEDQKKALNIICKSMGLKQTILKNEIILISI